MTMKEKLTFDQAQRFGVVNMVEHGEPVRDVLADMAAEIARKLAADQDALIRRCINERTGRSDWTLGEMLPRLRWLLDERNPWKILTLDGHAILKMWPPACQNNFNECSNMVQWSIQYEMFP